MDTAELFGQEKITKILWKMAPPVMLAQLIQALYNIVDSLFIGRWGETGLTALSIVYPLQLLMIALAVGAGVGINTVMAARMGAGCHKEAQIYAGLGTPIALGMWIVFAAVCWGIMPAYARMSTDSPAVIEDVIRYGRIVCAGGLGLFLESIWSKILQAEGNMKTPMLAQILGAVVNIVLDPFLIFGIGSFSGWGIAGAAAATAIGQITAAVVVGIRGFRPLTALHRHPDCTAIGCVGEIFRIGMPNMLMQSAYTFYILGLNLILAGFSDQAVTALGLYYKWQTFFFIPLGAMQTCIVPVLSFNYAAKNLERCRQILRAAMLFGLVLMAVGTLTFLSIPGVLLRTFSRDPLVIEIGKVGFRYFGVAFLPMVPSLTFPVFFQAVGAGGRSAMLTVIRTVVLFVPLGYLFSLLGLHWFWMTYPVTETITSLTGLWLYRRFLNDPYSEKMQKQG